MRPRYTLFALSLALLLLVALAAVASVGGSRGRPSPVQTTSAPASPEHGCLEPLCHVVTSAPVAPRPAPTRQASRSRPIATPKATGRAHRVQRAQIALREPVGALKRYAASLVGDPAQYDCLDRLWEKESGWDVYSSYGDAYGIPQAKPGYKMASEGSDWRTNGRTQIRWGVRYIDGRYQTMCAAWQHWLAHSWY